MFVALQAVVAVTTGNHVIAGAALDGVVAITTLNVVGTSAAVEYVITGIAIDNVIAITAIDRVIGGIAVQGVVTRRGGEHLALDGGHIPQRTVSELEVLHHVARYPVGVEAALHP